MWSWQDHEAYCYRLRRAQRITRDNFWRVCADEGWTRARGEAEALLGPPGDFTTRHVTYYPESLSLVAGPVGSELPTRPGDFTACWSGDGARIVVRFDKDGRPVVGVFEPALPSPAPRLPWWRRLFGR